MPFTQTAPGDKIRCYVTMWIGSECDMPNRVVSINPAIGQAQEAAQADFDYDDRGDQIDWQHPVLGNDDSLSLIGETGDSSGRYEIFAYLQTV